MLSDTASTWPSTLTVVDTTTCENEVNLKMELAGESQGGHRSRVSEAEASSEAALHRLHLFWKLSTDWSAFTASFFFLANGGGLFCFVLTQDCFF